MADYNQRLDLHKRNLQAAMPALHTLHKGAILANIRPFTLLRLTCVDWEVGQAFRPFGKMDE